MYSARRAQGPQRAGAAYEHHVQQPLLHRRDSRALDPDRLDAGAPPTSLGREGYERIAANLMENAGELEATLTGSGRFELLNDARYLPVVVVRPTGKEGVDVFELSERLRERGWIVPAYPLPPNAESVSVLRMVVRENFSRDMADMLGADIEAALAKIDGKPGRATQAQSGGRRRIC